MKLFILLSLFCLPAFADEICKAPTNSFEMPSEIVQAMDAVAIIWYAVSPTQYEHAVCKTHEVPEYNWWLANKSREARTDEGVKGYHFHDQPVELINAFRDITKNMTYQNSSCTDVLCAVDEIWGPEIGRKILYIRARHGFNTSELAFENTRRFKSSELDDILISMGDLPPEMEMVGRGRNQRMTLESVEARSPAGDDVLADSTIKFYDRWRNANNTFRRRYSLYHEFGHNISYQKGNLDNSPEWLSLPTCDVSKYGRTDRGEDFAESFVMYRLNGRGLQEKCPEKYAFLKQRAYGGREYLDESQCD